MTNKEAIEVLKEECCYECCSGDLGPFYCKATNCKLPEAVRMAIKALEQEPCEDAISRQAVEEALYDYSRSCDVNYAQIMERIDALPPVTPKQRTGHWVLSRSDSGARSYQCSLCGHWHPLHDHSLGFRYCNWCGAKMEEQ